MTRKKQADSKYHAVIAANLCSADMPDVPAQYQKYFEKDNAIVRWAQMMDSRAYEEWLPWELVEVAQYVMDCIVIDELQDQVDREGYLFEHHNGTCGAHPLLNEIKGRKSINQSRLRALQLTDPKTRSRQNGAKKKSASVTEMSLVAK